MKQFVKISVAIDAHKSLEFEQAISAMITSKLAENCQISRGQGIHCQVGKRIYYYFEEWPDENTMNRHMESDYFRTLTGAMKVLGEIVEANIIGVNTVIPVSDMID